MSTLKGIYEQSSYSLIYSHLCLSLSTQMLLSVREIHDKVEKITAKGCNVCSWVHSGSMSRQLNSFKPKSLNWSFEEPENDRSVFINISVFNYPTDNE